ncbi:saccharopine dehydrogenase NADP-binding domain-containing protein [Metabacillus arenae]|uniref:Saccharopine dehydrogenase NADP-binding domain-containing protein n=1 Tax=Metabacillus arenae TaxID=2771434 RepID=A0A926NLY7_9BACI|nr:saccharopine dehydrogenase NADP-binding domain-containing protein [Metabacillus arenae]MBD1383145.1 saccharopine dehydrogenase NADP-binding domain-containing protein [Metabacillus arenae]
MSKVLLFGSGEVGSHILEFLVRDPKCPELVVCDIKAEVGQKRVHNALSGASILRLYPKVSFKKVDLLDVEATARVIEDENPEVIINCAVLQTWHTIRKLPKEVYERLSAASLGAWLPCQLALAYHLMLAVKKSGLNPHVINTALSDLVNPVLAKVGLAPTIGIGNVELIEPAVKVFVSNHLQVPTDLVRIYLVAHHQWWVYPREAEYKKSPYFIKVMVNDRDVTNQFDTDQLLWDAIKLYPPGTEFTTVSASSTIKNMYALMNPSGIFTHSPSPKGLPGGYPIILSNKGAELALPEEISLEEAIKINEESAKKDGIDHVKDDGTVVYSDYTYRILKEMLGFDHASFKPEESFELAKELMSKYKEFASKHETIES